MSKKTLRFIIENIHPQKLSNNCLVSFKPIQDMMYIQLSTTTLDADFVKLCSTLTQEQSVLAQKMFDALKLYNIVNAYSVFLYLEIIGKDINITPTEIIEKFGNNSSVYVNAIIPACLDYIKEYITKGPENISNKELATRINFGNILQDLFLQAVISPNDAGIATYSIGGLTSSSIDSVTDKFYVYIAPYISTKEVIAYYSSTYYLNNYFFPSGLEYFTAYSKDVLGVAIPQYVPNYPPTDDEHLRDFCYKMEPQDSPAEESTGNIYFALFGI
jgi:hypothetical protein